jgi:hypothetical protein
MTKRFPAKKSMTKLLALWPESQTLVWKANHACMRGFMGELEGNMNITDQN